jgi:hypothetical protein
MIYSFTSAKRTIISTTPAYLHQRCALKVRKGGINKSASFKLIDALFVFVPEKKIPFLLQNLVAFLLGKGMNFTWDNYPRDFP